MPEVPEECKSFNRARLNRPLDPAELEELLRIRRSIDFPPRESAAWNRFVQLQCAHKVQYPVTHERSAWDAAGYLVVAHKLGWSISSLAQGETGEAVATAYPPCNLPELPLSEWAIVAVAGYVAEDRAIGNARPGGNFTALAKQVIASAEAQGYSAAPQARIDVALAAEQGAAAILEAHWEAVGRVAALAMGPLPVEYDLLVAALADVAQDEPSCGPRRSRRRSARRASS